MLIILENFQIKFRLYYIILIFFRNNVLDGLSSMELCRDRENNWKNRIKPTVVQCRNAIAGRRTGEKPKDRIAVRPETLLYFTFQTRLLSRITPFRPYLRRRTVAGQYDWRGVSFVSRFSRPAVVIGDNVCECPAETSHPPPLFAHLTTVTIRPRNRDQLLSGPSR